MRRSTVASVALAFLCALPPAMASSTDFPIALEDFPYRAARRYLAASRPAVLRCCPSSGGTELQACLRGAAEELTLAEAVSGVVPGSALHENALGVLMMTSARLSAR